MLKRESEHKLRCVIGETDAVEAPLEEFMSADGAHLLWRAFMTDITATVRGVAANAWLALVILLFLGLTLAVAASLRIERTDLLAATDDGTLVLTDNGQKVLVGRECRLVIDSYRLPFPWRC